MALNFGRGALALAIWLLVGCAPTTRLPSPADLEKMPVLAGVVSGQKTLDGEIYMPGDVLVPSGASLELRPGTVVYVQPAEGTKIDPEHLSSLTELLVRGRLDIRGTPRRPVRFVPLSRPESGDPAWAGIVLTGARDSRIVGARIESAETALWCIASSPELRDNTLRHNRYGIIAQQLSAPRIVGNLIEQGEGGVFCWRDSAPEITGNRIVGQVEEGIFIDQTSRPKLSRNQVTDNALGLVLYDRELIGELNEVRNNREDLRILSAPTGGIR